MIVAVLDTNVLVSGVLTPDGSPGRILDAVLDGLCLPVVTDRILAEYDDVLHRPKFQFAPSRVNALLDAIGSRSVVAPFAPFCRSSELPDPTDAIFVEAALGAHAPIVTGNLRHFPGEAVGGIPVLSPAAFLALLRPRNLV